MPSEAIDKLLELSEKEVDLGGGEPPSGDNDPLNNKRPEESEEIRDVQDVIEARTNDQVSNQEERITNNENHESIVVESRNYEEQENMNRDTEAENVMTGMESSSTHGYNLRKNRERDYSHCCFTMLSVKSGLKKWGEKAREAIMSELRLFITEEVFKKVKSPTEEQRRAALRIHCFITEKRDGRIKARAVADGRSQTRYLEEQTYSPTVKLESIMLCSIVDAIEGREVITIDIKGAFLKAKVSEDMELIVKMDGKLAELFLEINLKFKAKENGELYLKCLKALYGHIDGPIILQ